MRKANVKLKIVYIIIVICLTFFGAFAILSNKDIEVAHAEIKPTTMEKFLNYSGSDVFYHADLVHDFYVGAEDKDKFQIQLKQTKLTDHWFAGAPNFNNVKVTVTSPDGLLYTYSIPNGIKRPGTDLSCVMFDGEILKEDGVYNIKASGSISAGAEQKQTGYSSFIYDSVAPTGQLSVDNGAIVNSRVTFDYSGSDYLYYSKDTNSMPETATTQYPNPHNWEFDANSEGYYKLRLQDTCENKTFYTFIIDKTAPKLNLSGVVNNGFTSGNVSATWSDEIGNITAQRVSENDVLTVKYSISQSSNFPTTANTTYKAGTAFTEAGNYLIEISDIAGNKTQYKFTIDKTAPKLNLSGVVNNGFTNGSVSSTWSTTVGNINAQRVNNNDTLTVKYSISQSSSFPTAATTSYKSGTVLTAAGNYLIEISDKAGNKTKYYFTIDKAAPKMNFSGVTINGFTNGIVLGTWDSKTCVDITSQLSNVNDGLTVRFDYSTSATFPTTANTIYYANTELKSAGNYLFTITDKAGNSTSYKFTIDKTAPVLTLEGLKDFFTKGNVSATWSTAVEGIRGQRSNANDILRVRYALTDDGEFPTEALTEYVSGSAFNRVGNYLLEISDKAGNKTKYYFTIDRSAPTLTLSGVKQGGMTNANVSATWSLAISGILGQRANAKDKLSVKYSYLGGLEFPTSATKEYVDGNLTAEGNYLLVITDKAGNSTSYRFTIDKTAPNVVKQPDEFTNKDFSYVADDLHGVLKVEYRLDDGNLMTKSGAEIKIKAVPENYGVWFIRAIDNVGNISEWQKVKLLVRSDFGNLKDARNEYKVAAWYTVNLPSKTFPTASGKYSFETYTAALEFAKQKEWQYRVVTLSNGTWSYVSISNSSITQIYTKRSELDAAVLKYASANVSERKVLKSTGGVYDVPTDENGVSRPDALTKNNLVLPDILSQYADLPLLLVNHDYIFRMPNEVLSGNISTFVLSFVSDGITLQNANSKVYQYGNSIQSMLERDDAWQQGYYLITETDLCGNVEKYLVYLDIDTPTLTAETETGNGTKTTIIFDAAYVDKYKDVLLYTGFRLEQTTDNMDEFAMLMIDGRGLTEAVYVNGDELPYLCYEKGYYGKYNITIYDRSLNALSFTITVAGAPPEIAHSSLTNETRCRISINISDSNNAITSIRFFKVSYTGEYAPMSVDGDGTPIQPDILEYSLRTGGKYIIIVTDIFGREIQSKPLFYMKGLPSGMLSGVREDGVTNNTVTFRYENTNKILVYIFESGQWVVADDKVTIEEKSGYNYATIIANEENSFQYKIFLYVAEDMNLFVEYIFEIDSIPPTVQITTDEGEIEAETVTRLPFSVGWNEYGIVVYYYNKSSALGELSKARYTKDTILAQAGTYVFEISDAAGNMIMFNVTIDNIVSHTVDGSYSILSDGSYISKSSITLTVTEATLKWECESSNGIVPENGQTITTDGTYKMHIEDLYGNVLEITIIIDNLPPEPVIKTKDGDNINKDSKTNQAFMVSCEEETVVISYSSDGRTYVLYDGAIIEAEGAHYFKLTDRMGNSTAFVIRLDKTVDFNVSGKYLQSENGYLAQYITVTVDEEYSDFKVISNNGVTVELGKRITEEGLYTLTITDLAGNVIEIVIEIDLTAPTPNITTESGKKVLPNGKTNEPFRVTCEEEGTSLYFEVGSGFIPYDGQALTLSGKYTFRLLDKIGNENIFSVEFDGDIEFEIGGKYAKDMDGRYVSRTWLSITVLEDFVAFEVVSDNGRTFGNGERISYEGVYSVKVVDIAGNDITIGLVIDITSPEAIIQTLSGEKVKPNGKINEPFNVACSETLSTIEVSRNGNYYVLYDGGTLTEPAIYYFKVIDLAGNDFSFTIEFDSGVDFSISGIYKIDEQGRYVSALSLMVSVNEDYKMFEVVSSNGVIFGAGERIEEEGIYTVTITDFAENVIQIVVVIDKTAPKPIIKTQAGNEVVMNGKTNEAFTIKCYERGASIYWSTRDGDYTLYDGAVIDTEGRYYFKLTDFIGNNNVFSIVIDKTVNYHLKGLYKTVADNVYATNSGVALFIDEEYASFEVDTDEGQSIVIGEKIVREGRYLITLEDVVGNVIKIDLHVDYTAPIFTLSGVEPGGITGESVGISIDDFKTAYYQLYGSSERIALDNNAVIKKAGQYTVVAEDYAGNRSSVTFTIDGDMNIVVSPVLLRGQFITESIEFRFNEKMDSSLLTLNGGEPTVFNGGRITEAGEYTLTVVDLYGNTAFYSWTILPPVAQGYSLPLPIDYEVSILKDGAVVSNVIENNLIQLKENGIYELTFSSNNTTYTITLAVDTVKPVVKITQEKDKVLIDNPNKDNLTYELTLDGKVINFELGKALTAVGDYVLTITDEYGNQSVYSFSLNYINAWGIAVIVIAALVVVVLAIVVVVTRKRQGVR